MKNANEKEIVTDDEAAFVAALTPADRALWAEPKMSREKVRLIQAHMAWIRAESAKRLHTHEEAKRAAAPANDSPGAVFVLISKSTRPEFTPAWIAEQVADYHAYAQRVAERHGLPAPRVTTTPPKSGKWTPLFFWDDSDVAGAAGYHDVGPNGAPYGKAFASDALDAAGNFDRDTFTVIATHELGECLVNLYADCFRLASDGVARCNEIGDPAGSTTFRIRKTLCQNFVWPSWFRAETPTGARVDENGELPGALQKVPSDPIAYVILLEGGSVTTDPPEAEARPRVARKVARIRALLAPKSAPTRPESPAAKTKKPRR